jgi:ubiquinone/menaquinone biosynthesis C-methylase UbiE
MKTNWDYSHLAEAYLNRPDYSNDAINEMFSVVGLKSDDKVCDVGAGVAHLSIQLANRKLHVDAVEPNNAMRNLGIQRTSAMKNVQWHEGTGEETGMLSNTYNIVTFGSSFNVTDRPRALIEAKRLMINRGWFAAMWNHRNLEDPIQHRIEEIIKSNLPDYDYGTRREDQTEIIKESGLFDEPITIEGQVIHQQMIADVVDAWRSHATLHRQAGDAFKAIIDQIEIYLSDLNQEEIEIPYMTRLWLAQSK